MRKKQPNWKIPTEDELISEFEPETENDLDPQSAKDKIASNFNPYDPKKAKEMFTIGIVLSIIAIIFMIFAICYTFHLRNYYANNYYQPQIGNQPLQLAPSYGSNFEKMDNNVNNEAQEQGEVTQNMENQNVTPQVQEGIPQENMQPMEQNVPQGNPTDQNQVYPNNYNNNPY